MKLLYVSENINPVFFSQVVVLLNKLVEKGYFEEIYLALGVRDPSQIKEIYNLDSKIKLIMFKTYPMYPFFNGLTENSISKFLKFFNINNSYIIHTRIEFLGSLVYNAYLKLNAKKPNLLIDIRGSLIEELQIYGQMNFLLKYFKLLGYKSKIQKVLNNTKYINTVSDELKKYIENLYNIKKNTISVIPTIVSNKFIYDQKIRTKMRKDLGLNDDDIIFIFSSGSTQKWQNDDEIVNVLLDKGYKILMLSKKKYDNPNIISTFVPNDEVPNYLNAADVGIIIRNNDIVNKVASPIKFSEYLSCGLPVIANDSVDIINNILLKYKCGRVLNLVEIDNITINELLNLDRLKISKLGQSKFGIDQITDKYLSIYKEMCK